MTKNIITITILAALIFTSCKEKPNQENAEITTSKSVGEVTDDIVSITSTDTDGKKLNISYNNTKGTANIDFDGETSELVQEKSASGIWYKNEDFDLRGKGNDIELKKDGKVVFTHTDDIVTTTLKNDEGQTLDMTFNNTEGTLKAYLNGGEQIDLVAQKAASGIWYKNDQYELRGKGDSLELTEDGKTVFKN